MSASFIEQLPVRIGTDREFKLVAEALRRASFDEETVCRTLRLNNLSDLGWLRDGDEGQSAELRLLIRLFFYPTLVARVEVERVFDAATIEAFLSLGLLGLGEFGKDEFYARCWLYPVAGFLITSDRYTMPDGSAFRPPSDIVFPAIYRGSLQFLKLLPPPVSGDTLDVCAGTGIAAFVMSQSGGRVVSADLTERAAQFAQFNRALNGLENVEVVRSDLYDAVADRTFDCIVSHPPGVLTHYNHPTFREGYTAGESLLQRLFSGLTEVLRPGGLFYAMVQVVDTYEEQFEERVRSWLKGQAGEFDILFAPIKELAPQEVLKSLAMGTRFGPDDMKQKEAEFESVGISKVINGAVFMRRVKERKCEPWTARRTISEATRGADFVSAFVTQEWLRAPNSDSGILDATPRLAPSLQIKTLQVVHEGVLVAPEFILQTDRPFAARDSFDAWTMPVWAHFDGQTTVAKIYADARSNTAMPDRFRLEDFRVLVSRAIEAGYLVLR